MKIKKVFLSLLALLTTATCVAGVAGCKDDRISGMESESGGSKESNNAEDIEDTGDVENSDTYSQGLEYALSDDETYYTVSGIGTCKDKKIIIPEIYENLPVTSIGESAFSSCDSLTSITIPDSVTSIGAYAFEDTGYYNDESNWENGVLYLDGWLLEAKYNVVYGEYTIKAGTKGVAERAFCDCTYLTGVIVPDSVTSIGYEAFTGCSRLTIYCEAESQLSGWVYDWNCSRPVVWGYEN